MNKIICSQNIKNIDDFGGKVKGLLQLIDAGLNVPKFYILPYSLLIDVQKNKSLLNEVLKDWLFDNKIKTTKLFAVRSSASIEDGNSKSFAGLFSTKLNCQANALQEAIIEVCSGFVNNKSIDEYTDNKLFEFNIIIQEMIHADISGVIFSQNPTDIFDKNIFINIVPGSGEALVSGDVTGMAIKVGKNIDFLHLQDLYEGKNSENGNTILVKKEVLKTDITPFIKELVSKTKLLSLKFKTPIDIEFCVKNNEIFWLQMRPITTLYEPQYYDNTGIGENYPGVSMPLTISFVKQSYFIGYSGMLKFLSPNNNFVNKNEQLLANMVGGINGVIYYNITAWQKLLFQLPFGKFTSKAITRLLAMQDALFEKPKRKFQFLNIIFIFFKILFAFINFKSHKNKFLLSINNIINFEKNKDYSKLNYKELVNYFNNIQNQISEHWAAPLLNGFFTLFFYGNLKKIVQNSSIKNTHPNFTNDILFAQGEVISVKIIRSLQDIIQDIYNNEAVLKAFRNLEIVDLKQKTFKIDKTIFDKINYYIEHFGNRSEEGELRMETINYTENPNAFWEMLKQNVQFENLQQKNSNVSSFDYKLIIKQHFPNNFIKRWYVNFIIKNTIQRIKDRENFRFLRTQAFAIFRRLFMAIGKELMIKKQILNERDVLYLNYHEILNPELSANFLKIIALKKNEYQDLNNLEIPTRYVYQNEKYRPVYAKQIENKNYDLKGIGCCSGILQGTIAIVSPENIKDRNWEGKIVIAKNFEPGWISLFANAKGLISERGSLLSHTSILCRELQIPSIVGVNGLLNTLNNGDNIVMDGATGIINKIINE